MWYRVMGVAMVDVGMVYVCKVDEGMRGWMCMRQCYCNEEVK